MATFITIFEPDFAVEKTFRHTDNKRYSAVTVVIVYVFFVSLLNISFFPTIQESALTGSSKVSTQTSLLELILEDIMDITDYDNQLRDEENDVVAKVEYVFSRWVLKRTHYTLQKTERSHFFELILDHPTLKRSTPPPEMVL